jgi:hypothetical protein
VTRPVIVILRSARVRVAGKTEAIDSPRPIVPSQTAPIESFQIRMMLKLTRLPNKSASRM